MTTLREVHNPTSYVFPASVQDIRYCFRRFRIYYPPLEIRGRWLAAEFKTSFNQSSQKWFFPESANEMDIKLDSLTNPLGLSDSYVDASGKGLPYNADFFVHLFPKGTKHTRVVINTYKPSVILGSEFSFGHAWERYVYVDVKPTTIEEYMILLQLGSCLGIKDMPPLLLP
jgi:hypothetical protein